MHKNLIIEIGESINELEDLVQKQIKISNEEISHKIKIDIQKLIELKRNILVHENFRINKISEDLSSLKEYLEEIDDFTDEDRENEVIFFNWINEKVNELINIFKQEFSSELKQKQNDKEIEIEINKLNTILEKLTEIKNNSSFREFLELINKHYSKEILKIDETNYEQREKYFYDLGLRVRYIDKKILEAICSNEIFIYFKLIESKIDYKHLHEIFYNGLSLIFHSTEINEYLIDKKKFSEFVKFLFEVSHMKESRRIDLIYDYNISEVLTNKDLMKRLIDNNQFIPFLRTLVDVSDDLKIEDYKNVFHHGVESLMMNYNLVKTMVENDVFIGFLERMIKLSKMVESENKKEILQDFTMTIFSAADSVILSLIEKKKFLKFLDLTFNYCDLVKPVNIHLIYSQVVSRIIDNSIFCAKLINKNIFIEFFEKIVFVASKMNSDKDKINTISISIIDILEMGDIMNYLIDNNIFIEFMNFLVEITYKFKANETKMIYYAMYSYFLNDINKIKFLVESKNFNKYKENFIKLSLTFDTDNSDLSFEAYYSILYNMLNFKYEELFTNFFLKEVKNSRDKARLLLNFYKLNRNSIVENVFLYYLEYSPKEIFNFLNNINIALELNLKVSEDEIESKLTPLTYYSNEVLAEIFRRNKAQIILSYQNLLKNMISLKPRKKILFIFERDVNSTEEFKKKSIKFIRHLEILEGKIKQGKDDFALKKSISEMFAEVLFFKFENLKKSLIRSKFDSEFKLTKFDEKMIDEDFAYVYKMFSSNLLKENKSLAKELIQNYLDLKTYPYEKNLFNSYPYNVHENMDWITSVNFDVHEWFLENKKIMRVGPLKNDEIFEKTKNEFETIIRIFKKNGLKVEFRNYNEMFDFHKKFINDKNLVSKFNAGDLKEINFHIDNIRNAISSKKRNGRVISEVEIYHELNPIKASLMGKYFENSCLNFDSKVGYFYSSFSNALDANKSVFYIKSDSEIIGRVLCCFTRNGKLARFDLYQTSVFNVDLNSVFNEYIKNLAKKCKIELVNSASDEEFDKLICEEWYDDGTVSFDSEK